MTVFSVLVTFDLVMKSSLIVGETAGLVLIGLGLILMALVLRRLVSSTIILRTSEDTTVGRRRLQAYWGASLFVQRTVARCAAQARAGWQRTQSFAYKVRLAFSNLYQRLVHSYSHRLPEWQAALIVSGMCGAFLLGWALGNARRPASSVNPAGAVYRANQVQPKARVFKSTSAQRFRDDEPEVVVRHFPATNSPKTNASLISVETDQTSEKHVSDSRSNQRLQEGEPEVVIHHFSTANSSRTNTEPVAPRINQPSVKHISDL